jgi:hypothetical protein
MLYYYLLKKLYPFHQPDSVHINCDTKPGFIVNAPEIHLGLAVNGVKEEPIIKGDTLKLALNNLLDGLNQLLSGMSKPHGDTTPYTFVGDALSLQTQISSIKQTISDSLSTQNYTI